MDVSTLAPRTRLLLAASVCAALVLLVALGAVSIAREQTLDHQLESIQLAHLEHTTELVQGVAAGLTITNRLRVERAIRIHPVNRPLLELFQGFEPTQSPRFGGERHAPFGRSAAHRTILRDGAPLERLTVANGLLGAGLYEIRTTWWYWGIRANAEGAPRCKSIRDIPAELTSVFVATPSLAMRTDSIAKLTESRPMIEGQRFALAYRHEQWLANLERLPIPECVGG